MKKLFLSLLFTASICLSNSLYSQTGGAYDINSLYYNSYYTKGVVDLVTGDMVYGLTLGKIGSPESSIPIGMQYHAGITVDQPASWVGLGWSYFPGAITRNVNVLPDDWNGKNVEEFLVKPNNGTVNLDSINVWIGYGTGSYASVGLQAIIGSTKNMFDYTRKTIKTIDNDSYTGYGSLYFKNSINGIVNYEVYGGMSEKDKIKMDVYSRQLDEYDTKGTHNLYPNAMSQNYFGDDIQSANNAMLPAYDEYRISGPTISGKLTPRILSNAYLVNGENEGLSYHYDPTTINNTLKDPSNIYYYFTGENSGYYSAKGGKYEVTYTIAANGNKIYNYTLNDLVTGNHVISGSTSQSHTIPSNLQHRYSDNECYNETTKRPCTAKHTEWFTNSAIYNNQVDGFIECENMDGNRNDNALVDPDGIGAFRVTLEDGTVYHYSLPVYQFEQFFRDEQGSGNPLVDDFSVISGYFEHRTTDKYAYAWYLTAITGSDYIDNNNNGIVDDGDYGFWIKYNYGKWTDGYLWRTPSDDGEEYTGSKGNPATVDNVLHRNFHWGRKQIYYLNSIQTRTYSAFFIKSLRDDAIGLSQTAQQYEIKAYYNLQKTVRGDWTIIQPGNPNNGYVYSGNDQSIIHSKYYVDDLPQQEGVKLLKLDKIVIVKNEPQFMGNTFSSSSINYNNLTKTVTFKKKLRMYNFLGFGSATNMYSPQVQSTYRLYYHENMIESEDDIITLLNEKSLYSVDFTYDYSHYNTSDVAEPGKLALKEIRINGLEGNKLLPTYKFEYNKYLFNYTSKPRSNYVDSWGYDNTSNSQAHPDNWSLNTITTPIGGTVEIEYEPDTYSREEFGENFNSSCDLFDGGLRVKEMSLNDMEGHIYKTQYEYSIPSEINNSHVNSASSGITIYSPFRYQYNFVHFPFYNELPTPEILYEYVKVKSIGSDNKTDSCSSLFVFETADRLPGTNKFLMLNMNNFISQDEDSAFRVRNLMVGLPWNYSTSSYNDYTFNNCYIRSQTILDNFNILGRPLGFISYNKFENIVSKTIYNYYPVDSISGGVFEESFQNRKLKSTILYYPLDITINNWYLTNITKVSYPSVLQGIYTFDNGTEGYAYNSKFNLLTGDPVEDAYGTSKSSYKIVPAYKIPLYQEFGSKALDINNKNMLDLNAEEWAFDSLGNVMNINISTWNKCWKYRTFGISLLGNLTCYNFHDPEDCTSDVWRSSKSYMWKGSIKNNGTYKNFSGKEFDWSLANLDNNSTNGWLKGIEITRYNHFSTPVEAVDINGNAISSKIDHLTKNVVSSASNSEYEDFGHTSFENESVLSNGYKTYDSEFFFDNYCSDCKQMISCNEEGAIIGDNAVTGLAAHTGTKYFKLYNASHGPEFRIAFNTEHPSSPRTYRVSVWVNENSGNNVYLQCIIQNSDGSSSDPMVQLNKLDPKVIKVNGWYLLSMDVDITNSNSKYIRFYVVSVGVAYIDDFRVQPVDASVNGFVYNSLGYKVADLDNENLATFYEYNDVGKLLRVSKETVDYGIKTVAEYDYHYARQDE